MVLLHILIATILVGLISFIGVLFFALKMDVRKMTFGLVSLASGTMLGGALLHLIPESLESSLSEPLLFVAAGVFLFFVLEKFLIWRHCHHHQHPDDCRRPVAATMILTGDTIHNFADGLIIASAFLAGTPVGISVTVAIMLHEIPQEIGDFGVLIHGGFPVKKALLFNGLTAASAVAGGVLTYFLLGVIPTVQSFILPLAAGGFLYIALADLIPQLHEHPTPKHTLTQILLLLGGFGVMWLLKGH